MELELVPPEPVQQLLAQMVRGVEQRLVSSRCRDVPGDQHCSIITEHKFSPWVFIFLYNHIIGILGASC